MSGMGTPELSTADRLPLASEPPVVVVLAALDTKGEEAEFLAESIRSSGARPWLVDIGLAGQPVSPGDTTRATVAAAAGLDSYQGLTKHEAMAASARGASVVVTKMVEDGVARAVIGIGGGQGSWIATSVMNALALGFPKVMVSTRASAYGDKDIISVPSITDIAGINFILGPILENAGRAVSAMARHIEKSTPVRRARVALTMFGVTTTGATYVRRLLEKSSSIEVVTFHANGAGGRMLEKLVRDGCFAAVVDFTTSELIDELVGGSGSAGPDRLSAAGECGIPQVVVPGAIDLIGIGSRKDLPARFADRIIHMHIPNETRGGLMRTSALESADLGRIMGAKLNVARGPVSVVVPEKGFSALDAPGQPFEDLDADREFSSAIKRTLRDEIRFKQLPFHINDEQFASIVVDELFVLWPEGRALVERDDGRSGSTQ